MTNMPQGPFSQPPLAGSKSDEPWVRRNATMFSAGEASSLLKALLLFLVVVVVAVPLLLVLVGPWGVAVGVWALALALVVRVFRRRRKH